MKKLSFLAIVAGTLAIFASVVPGSDFIHFGRDLTGGVNSVLPVGILTLLGGLLAVVLQARNIGSVIIRITKSYKIIAILTLNTLVILAGLEVASKGILKSRETFLDNPPPVPDPRATSSYYASKGWAPRYWKEFALSRKQQYHPYVVWRRAPFKGETINIDERGIRVTPGAACKPNAFKVFMFGGSPMWGTGSPDWGTIPAYLQAGLEKYRSGAICVANFGEFAYVSTQSVITLLLQLQSRNIPDVAIFFDGVNDVYAAYQSGKPAVHENFEHVAAKLEGREEPKPPLSVQLLKSLSLYKLVNNQVRRFSRGSEATPKLITYETKRIDTQSLGNSVVQTYTSNYQSVAALAQQYGFKYYFFLPPYISIGKKPLTSEEEALKRAVDPALERLYHSVYETIGPRVHEYDNLYLMTGIFDDYESLLWLDDTHVTPVGNQIIAQKMLQVIADRRPTHVGLTND